MAERKDNDHRTINERRIDSPAKRPILNYALWIAQLLLTLLFLFAGGMKLIMPPEALAGPVQMPVLFLRFIGVCEVLGGLGLVLPGALRIRPGLTPLAAAGLVIIMIGATVITVIGGPAALALMPLAAGLLSAFVAYGRWQLLPHRARTGSRSDSQLEPLSSGL